MKQLILAGLVIGSIYAISAMGLVLTYQSSRVLNFGHGAIAYAVAIFHFWLRVEQGWSIPAAGIVAILVLSPLLGLFLWAVLFRRLTDAPPEVRFVSTVGLWVALPALVKLVFPFAKGEETSQVEGLSAVPYSTFEFLGLNVNEKQAAVLAGAVFVAVAVTLLLRLTPLGLAIRATVDSPRTARISGINTTLVTASSWMLGATLAGFAGVLLSPILGTQDIWFTLLLVGSFAAVVVGRLRSLPLTFAGALLIGVAQEVSREWLPNTGVFAKGFRPSLPFFVMLACLLLYQGLRRERFDVNLRGGPAEPEAPTPPPLRGWRAAIGPFTVALVLLFVPLWLDDFWIGILSQGMALAVLFLSFTLVTGEGGMLSLCQASLAGIGAFTAAKLATDAGWPVGIALLAGALLAVPIGLAVAGLSLRLGEVYLALATLAFALLVENLVFARDDFENFALGVQLPKPVFFGIDFNDLTSRTEFYVLLVVIFCVVALFVRNLQRSTSGLVFASMRSSEPAAATTGISIVRSKLFAFGASAFVAGLGGGLFAMTIGRAVPVSFNVLVGIVWLAIVVTWGVRSVLGALIAGLLFVAIPQLVSENLSQSYADVPTMLFGLGAIALARQPRGVLFDIVNRRRLRRLRRAARREEQAAATEEVAA